MSLKLSAPLSLFLVLILITPCRSWDGYDSDSGSSVEIENGNLVREGQDIEVYDHGTGDYLDVEVESIRRFGGSVEVEVYDYDTGEYRTFEMEE